MKNLQITLSIKLDDTLIAKEEVDFICGATNPRDIERFILMKSAPFLSPFDSEKIALIYDARKAVIKRAIFNASNTPHFSQV